MSAFHAFEKTYFISITAGILCPIFQISVLPALQILCQSSALKNLCQPRRNIPPPTAPSRTPTPPLMWQNKPRPIRIKALKRSLKPLKVPLNWGATIWAVWQQMLNGAIARPPRWGLLSHHALVWKHSRAWHRLQNTHIFWHPPCFSTGCVCVFFKAHSRIFPPWYCCPTLFASSTAPQLPPQDNSRQTWRAFLFAAITIFLCWGSTRQELASEGGCCSAKERRWVREHVGCWELTWKRKVETHLC